MNLENLTLKHKIAALFDIIGSKKSRNGADKIIASCLNDIADELNHIKEERRKHHYGTITLDIDTSEIKHLEKSVFKLKNNEEK